MVPEAPLQETEHGLTVAGDGWFVLNMRDARWWYRGHGFEAGMEGKADFSQLGVSLVVLEPGDDWGAYTVSEAAIRHGAGVNEETTDAYVAYAGLPGPDPMPY